MPNIKAVHDWPTDLTAGVSQSPKLNGSFIFVYQAEAEFTIRIGERQPVLVRQGSFLQIEEYETVEVVSVASQSIRLKYGYGTYTELSAIISIDPDQPAIETFSEQSNTVASDATAIGAGLNASIVPADGTGVRRSVIISNLATSAGTIWIREDSATTAEGVPLGIGEKYVMNTASEIFAYNPNGSSVTAYTQTESVI